MVRMRIVIRGATVSVEVGMKVRMLHDAPTGEGAACFWRDGDVGVIVTILDVGVYVDFNNVDGQLVFDDGTWGASRSSFEVLS